MPFSELGLSPEVVRAVGDAGYSTPTPIQTQAIPVVLMGRDLLGCAQTGTGKTAAFTLPMIDILASGRARARMPRSLIIEPTRELAAQVAENFETYGKYNKLTMALLIGGESFSDQERRLDRGVDVLIATPGRLLDLYERGKILMSDVKILVIDEADRMLDMGFIPDVEKIVSLIPKLRQTLFFSATMPPEIRRLADAFLMNPREISVAPPASPATTVTQGLVTVEAVDKRDALRRLIQTEDIKNALIFCNRKRDVDILFRSLQKHGLEAAALHGDMPQPKRVETLDRFKRGEFSILVASDVAARGLDIVALSHVFNFDVPIHPEDYVHRIGRTGRAGRDGRAFTLATPDDGRFVGAIEKLIGRAIPRIEIEGFGPVEFAAEDGEGRRRGGDRRRSSSRRSESGAAESSRGERSRGERSRSERPRSERPRAAASERTPAEQAPIEQAQLERTPAEPVAAAEPAPVRRTREPKPAPRAERREREEPMEAPVLAFGDHMPDFLRRPVRLPKPALLDKTA